MHPRNLSFTTLLTLLVLTATAAWAGKNKVQVCHFPPGNPGNFHTISISENALSAHLGHGDVAGSCFDCPCVGEYPGFIETLNGQNGTLLSCTENSEPGSEIVALFTSSDFIPVAAIAPEAFCGNFNTVAQFITVEQGQACYNLIKQRAAAADIECLPPSP